LLITVLRTQAALTGQELLSNIEQFEKELSAKNPGRHTPDSPTATLKKLFLISNRSFRLTVRMRSAKSYYQRSYLGSRPNRRLSMAAIVPAIVMILIVALVMYLAWRSAYKRK
jgi:hypothetical protein